MKIINLFVCLFALICGPSRHIFAATNQTSDTLFSTPKVLQLKLEIPGSGLESLRKDAKTYVKASLREGDKTYANIGVRLKGASSVKLLDKKPSFTIKFDEFDSEQTFYDYDRIVLHNALSDPSFLCEAIGGELFRAAGVPALKTTFAQVNLNGRDLGIYVVTQAPNRTFLSDHFKKTKGNFYEGEQMDINEKLRLDSGTKDQKDIQALLAATREGDLNQRLKKIEAVLDLDGFLSFLAGEVFAWHRSGYTLDRDHYRIYHDPVSDRLVFIPDGLDSLFSSANAPLVPDAKGLLSRAVLETPEGQRLYRERLSKLLGTAFKPEVLVARVNQLAGKLRPVIGNDKSFETAVAQLRDTITQRARFLADELKKPPGK